MVQVQVAYLNLTRNMASDIPNWGVCTLAWTKLITIQVEGSTQWQMPCLYQLNIVKKCFNFFRRNSPGAAFIKFTMEQLGNLQQGKAKQI